MERGHAIVSNLSRITLAVVCGLALLAPLPAQAVSPEVWNFDVLLDDRTIGEHRFTRETHEGKYRVVSEADFEVRFLLFRAFEYEHSNTEVWNRGCLQSISARTETNGRVSQVIGSAADGGFRLRTLEDESTLDSCVGTFAYWDRELIERDRLLNAQTGEYIRVKFESLGQGTLRIEDATFAVDRLRLSASDVNIIVSYDSQSGEWLGLESVLKKGRTLRYLRNPDDLEQADLLTASAATDPGEAS